MCYNRSVDGSPFFVVVDCSLVERGDVMGKGAKPDILVLDTSFVMEYPESVLGRRLPSLSLGLEGSIVVIPAVVISELCWNERKKGPKRDIAKMVLSVLREGFGGLKSTGLLEATAPIGSRSIIYSLVRPPKGFFKSMPEKLANNDDFVIATALYCALESRCQGTKTYRDFNFKEAEVMLVTGDRDMVKKARKWRLPVTHIKPRPARPKQEAKKEKTIRYRRHRKRKENK